MAESNSQSNDPGSQVRVTFQPLGVSCKAPQGLTIMEAAASLGIDLRSDCGGQGKCGKCLVEVSPPANVSALTGSESDLLSAASVGQGGRLACVAKVAGPLVVLLPESALDSREAIGKTFSGKVLAADRQRPKAVGRKTEVPLGAAFDIGTTTLALYLCDLRSGEVLHAEAAVNPQRRYGEDVISRIAYANAQPDGLADLHKTLIRAVNKLLGRGLEATGSDRGLIERISVVGNTTMQHLFAGLHPRRLGVSPYMPESCEAQNYLAADLGLAVNDRCPVQLFPVISGFVGGDTVAVMLSEKPYLRDETSLIIDIGTNGEIILGNRESIWVTSCATGPALEGAHIECGMRAATGAIEKVYIDPADCSVAYETIGSNSAKGAKGLCGSGIIDAVAEMVKARLILPSGRLREGMPGVLVDAAGIGREFIIAAGNGTPEQPRVVLTLADVRQVQLAKSALATGIKLLMQKAGLETFDHLILTGAFGARFNWRNAVAIGMLPECTHQARVTVVENDAGRGAVMALLDESLGQEIRAAAENAQLLELAEDPAFAMEFALQTSFPERS